MDARIAGEERAVVTCSALRKKHRDLLRRPRVRFVYLHGDRELIAVRMAARQGHFFKPDLLESQFEALEEPGPDEPVLTLEVGGAPAEIVDEIAARIGLAIPPRADPVPASR